MGPEPKPETTANKAIQAFDKTHILENQELIYKYAQIHDANRDDEAEEFAFKNKAAMEQSINHGKYLISQLREKVEMSYTVT